MDGMTFENDDGKTFITRSMPDGRFYLVCELCNVTAFPVDREWKEWECPSCKAKLALE